MTTLKYVTITLVVLLGGCWIFYYLTSVSKTTFIHPVSHQIIVSPVECGEFEYWIPQTGTVRKDTILNEASKVIVPIDQLYFSKISRGLKAITILDGKEFYLTILEVDSTVTDGRFQVVMGFDREPYDIRSDQTVRLKILLSEPSTELLLPTGEFFKQTGGKWIFILEGTTAIKKKINLGRMSQDYFEVKDGLKAGDRVITSSYELFEDRDSIGMSVLLKLSED